MCQAVWKEKDLAGFFSHPNESHLWDSTAFSPWPQVFALRGPASIDQLLQWLHSSNTWLKLKSPLEWNVSLAQSFRSERLIKYTLRLLLCLPPLSEFHLFTYFLCVSPTSIFVVPVCRKIVFIKRLHLISLSLFFCLSRSHFLHLSPSCHLMGLKASLLL